MKILIDNGHGKETPGKRSPDSTFFEWQFNREIATRLCEELVSEGYDAERIVTTDEDISLMERCNRVNAICQQLGRKNVVLISIHANAAGKGNWSTARGWTGWVAKQASANSRLLAQLLYDQAMLMGYKGNRSVPPTHYWQADFAIIKRTLCPAVLTENLFYDNVEDLAILKSETGKSNIVQIHVDAIKRYVNDFMH